jgi:hypothetical protein
MKISKPENNNYAAVVTTVKSITPLAGADNIVGTPLFGFQAIVGKDTKVGDVGVVFPAETQLSDEFASQNNLYAHGDRNKDESAKGYLGDKGRIRSVRLRGHRSDCLFLPLSSLSYIKGFNINELADGDVFDRIGDHEICRKYVLPLTAKERRVEKNKDKFVRVEAAWLPKHYDTDNFFRYAHVIPPECEVIVTQKLHGTSIRVGNTIVRRKLTLRDRVAKLIGAHVAEREFDYVFGSRNVIKDANNPYQNHFYGDDIFTQEGKKLEGLIPEGYILYGELIGWTASGAPIQRNYTYQVPELTSDLYIYRIAHVNPQGKICDLSWDQVKEFCATAGLKHVPELWRGKMRDFDFVSDILDKAFYSAGLPQAVPLAEESPCDEGICIRVDGIAPYILKAKSPLFLEHETKMNDQGISDLETEN